jgi:hypothetical protein
MKKRLIGFIGLVTLTMFGASLTVAQDPALRSAAGDKWVITAKAGGVNYVQGSVSIDRTVGKSGMLLKGDTIQVGDCVSTGANGRAEILLNPGSYLRLAENSSFEFTTTSLEDLQVSVIRGSVMLEVFAANDFRVAVNTPKDSYDLIETGVYRIDVSADGAGRIEVWKGKAEVGDETLKGGRTASSLDGQTAIAKFDRDERDDFEDWSRARAKELAKATDTLKDRTLRTSLMRSFLGGRWNMYDSFGLWVYSAQYGRYCFLPFGYGWSSPYGYGFGSNIYWYRLPSVIYYPPPSSGGPVAGNPPRGGTQPPAGTPPRDRRPINGAKRDPRADGAQQTPPFAKMQGSGRGTGPDTGGSVAPSRSGGLGGFGGDRSGGFTPAPSIDPGPRLPSPKVDPMPVNPGGSSRGGSKSPVD